MVTLTASEEAVRSLLVSGLSNAEIAAKLACKPKTVKFHLTNIYKKAGVQSRNQLTAFALQQTASESVVGMQQLIVRLESESKRMLEEDRKALAGAHRTREQIEAAWPAVLRGAKLHPESAAGKQMLIELLATLKL